MSDEKEFVENNGFIFDILVYLNKKDNTLLISDVVIGEIDAAFMEKTNVDDYIEIFNFSTNDLEQANNMARMITTLYTAGLNNTASKGDGMIKLTPFIAMKYYHNSGTPAHQKVVAGLYRNMEKMFGL